MAQRILWASPFPPVRSGVSDYSVDVLEPLCRLMDIGIVRSPDSVDTPELPPALRKLPVVERDDIAGEDLVVAHIGNNSHHRWIVEACRGHRTVAVVHDLVLHHLLVHLTLDGNGGPSAYREGMVRAHGAAGAALADARSVGLIGRLDPFLFPAFGALLSEAEGFVCHSEFAESRLSRAFPDRPILRIGLPVDDPGPVDREAIRAELGIAADEVALMHLGFLTGEKGLPEVLGGVAAAVHQGLRVRLVLAGDDAGMARVRKAAEAVGLARRLLSTGWLDTDRMQRVPAAADLGVVFRTPSAGETSAAVVRFLACGTPVAVLGRHQFLEWPEAAALRITPGPSSAAGLARALLVAGADPGWKGRRSAARLVYEQAHRPGDAARSLADWLQTI